MNQMKAVIVIRTVNYIYFTARRKERKEKLFVFFLFQICRLIVNIE